ncbi:Hydroxyquinol 1,2-dioxygenase [Grifola frondosa]|uniref:Hydroxyquinol 1,2-dioxygenase n=1 Tax=Grifola frondosa TaxID=5627 RepID=A0A1C7LTM5_GRIFR|nr:Hydroxyquinol 1,2-dioxygenase [Grifola frondosa]
MDHNVEGKAVSNGISPPDFELPFPDGPETVTENTLKLVELTPDPRHKFIAKNLITHLHQFISEMSITTEEWMYAIQFLTRVGQKSTPLRQEFILLSDTLGVSALVDAINNPPANGALRAVCLGPSSLKMHPMLRTVIRSPRRGGDYMYVEGRVLSMDGTPIAGARIETWETDSHGLYDNQYAVRDKPDCRGRLHSDEDGRYGYRAVVPVAYPVPSDGPVGEMLLTLGRHNMRPNHLHLSIEAPGFKKLVTALYPEGDKYLRSDAVFGVKESLVVKLQDVDDDAEARRRGFPRGGPFKLLQFDIIMVPKA